MKEKGQWCKELWHSAVAWIVIGTIFTTLYGVLASSFLALVSAGVFEEKIFLTEFGGLAGSWKRMPSDATCVFAIVAVSGVLSKVGRCLLLAWAFRHNEALRQRRHVIRVI